MELLAWELRQHNAVTWELQSNDHLVPPDYSFDDINDMQ